MGMEKAHVLSLRLCVEQMENMKALDGHVGQRRHQALTRVMRKSINGSQGTLLLLLFVISFSLHGAKKELFVKAGQDSWDLNVKGFECEEEADEECQKRRTMAEAHLDYIYTQQHSP
ncbi:phytosulfokines 6 [Canna indica]|uniref:Phytosulfokine n=1 Tax=Canna indica TaxID=4628 RepID=A0AAQ3Q5J4_9LILI|nr:phytosulfokines 6 [Canna indica]